MQKSHTKRVVVSILFIMFICGNIISSAMSVYTDDNNLFSNKTELKSFKTNIISNDIKDSNDEHLSLNSESNLKIEDISGGIGLTFIVKNDGELDISEINLNIETEGLYIKRFTNNNTDISLLTAGASKKITFKVFGFCFGEPMIYNRITITISGPNITTMKRILLVNVIGPIVEVIEIFINDGESYDGYTLFSPEYSTETYLINKDGKTVHRWKSDYILGLGFHLLENGSLIRNCLTEINPAFPLNGGNGRVEMFDWNGTLMWEYELSNDHKCLHHEIEIMPNGNVLMLGWEIKSAYEAIAAGRNPLLIPAGVIWTSFIIEVEPIYPKGGNIVWEWYVWDHLVQEYDPARDNYGIVKDHPELIDINFGIPLGLVDLNHLNSLDYNEEFDQILVSSHIQNEIWIIDHSTTIEEAAKHNGGKYGKGGDLLYRWGNPQVYQAGNEYDQKFFGQHDARWIEQGCPGKGNILVFNNGLTRLDSFYSSVDEIVPPVDSDGNYYLENGSAYGPKEPIWSYTAEEPTDFFAPITSGAQRLPNGNTLICDGSNGVFFEVTLNKEVVWKYINLYPNTLTTQVAKIDLYPPDYPGLGEFNIKQVNNAPGNKYNSLIDFLFNILKDFNVIFSNLLNYINNL
jgi:hypothetical protein